MTTVTATTNPLPLLEALIRCPSITPEEGGALTLIEEILKPFGFQTVRLPFGEVDNLFARLGTGQPHLCFAGHTDVVPPGAAEDWKHAPFAAEIVSGFLYGRGASDMKGSIAAFLAAAIDVAKAYGPNLPGSLSFLITGDEEGPALNGTVKVLEWMHANGQIPDHCIVGEPTCSEVPGDTIKIGRRGSISFSVLCEGVQGHVAYPQRADNPVPKLARLVDLLSTRKIDGGNENFDPSSLVVTSFDVANTVGNIIPPRAFARFNIRYNTSQTFETLTAWVQARIDDVKETLGGRFTLDAYPGSEAFLTNPGEFVDIVQTAIQELTGVNPQLSTSGGTSDARFIRNYCPVLEFGPSNATVHQVDERISIEELKTTADIYRRIAEKYFESAA